MSSTSIKITFGPNIVDIYKCCFTATFKKRKLVVVNCDSLGKPVVELPSAAVNDHILASSYTICQYLMPEIGNSKLMDIDIKEISPFFHDLTLSQAQQGLTTLENSSQSGDVIFDSTNLGSLFLIASITGAIDSNVSNYFVLKQNYPELFAQYTSFKTKHKILINQSISKAQSIANKHFPNIIAESYPVLTSGYGFTRSLSKFFHSISIECFPFIPLSLLSNLEIGKMNKKSTEIPDLQYSIALKIFGIVKKLQNKELKQYYSYSIKSPRDIAEILVKSLNNDHFLNNRVIRKFEVSGAGFINIFLKQELISNTVKQVLQKQCLEPVKEEKLSQVSNGSYLQGYNLRVGIDMSAPNVAKEMHVGHLRSTIIGEVLARVLRHRGHIVKKINHIGDWGTQFGMLLTFLKDAKVTVTPGETSLTELNVIYKQAKKRFDEDEDFKTRARETVVRLQRGDEHETNTWKKLIAISETGFEEIYKRLDVNFEDGNCGESFYQSRIPAMISEVKSKNLLEEYEGAKIVTTSITKVPLFIQKSDGGFGYDTTDMTALKYRIEELKLDRILYVCDLGQTNHFLSCFELAEKLGWLKAMKVGPQFIGFGVVCGKDGKRFRSRSGETVTLRSLLDEAKSRIQKGLVERLESGDTSLQKEEIEEASAKLGYSAIKFFDLRNSREKDYVFDYDQMIQPMGNTGVYIIYTYARICSIERKIESLLGLDVKELVSKVLEEDSLNVNASTAKEWELAKVLTTYGDTMIHIEDNLQPHLLCTFVYDVCVAVSKFYSEHQLLVRDPTSASGKNLDREHGVKWVCLLHSTKQAIEETAPLIGIQLIDRI